MLRPRDIRPEDQVFEYNIRQLRDTCRLLRRFHVHPLLEACVEIATKLERLNDTSESDLVVADIVMAAGGAFERLYPLYNAVDVFQQARKYWVLAWDAAFSRIADEDEAANPELVHTPSYWSFLRERVEVDKVVVDLRSKRDALAVIVSELVSKVEQRLAPASPGADCCPVCGADTLDLYVEGADLGLCLKDPSHIVRWT